MPRNGYQTTLRLRTDCLFGSSTSWSCCWYLEFLRDGNPLSDDEQRSHSSLIMTGECSVEKRACFLDIYEAELYDIVVCHYSRE